MSSTTNSAQRDADLVLQPLARRMTFYVLGFLALAAVANALLLQTLYDLQPCPWCILQRYAYLLLGVVLLVRAAVPGQGRLACGLSWAAGLVAVVGALMASFQLWVVSSVKVSCGRDTLAAFLNGLPPAKVIPSLFEATGSCADAIPINFPALALGGFVLLAGANLWLSLKSRTV